LRACQRGAIVTGDADLYAGLCTDDVQLLLQDRALVSGRAAFLECERALLGTTRFRGLDQRPTRVERQGTLAVETGRQEVELEPGAGEAESYRRLRKYVHVLRRTERGWRFAVLSSNNGA
jgi:ketosteroid isomerase-like protein